IAALLLAAVGAYCIELAIPKHDYFVQRAGTLRRVEIIDSSESVAISETVELESSTGLLVSMRTLRPRNAAARRLPLVLVLSGRGAGKDAVELVSDPQGIAYAAIDYPYDSDQALDEFWTSAAGLYAVQQAFIDTPPAVLLALSWLLQQPWVDQKNVELVGVSLGVPFAAVAGAVDKRFTRVWLMHGGGDNLSWVMYLARDQIENDTLRNLASRVALFAVYGNSFNTARWIRETAPRPVIIVAAHDDDIVPRSSQQPLIEAATSEHVELIWTEGQHVGRRRQEEVQLLLDIISSRVAAAR
ncbi:MAG: acetylxylan esterase, partial [Gammaproteobacteria bacterium]|nr:acetylxylan esterase [Gammaproteobacteria bacterium]